MKNCNMCHARFITQLKNGLSEICCYIYILFKYLSHLTFLLCFLFRSRGTAISIQDCARSITTTTSITHTTTVLLKTPKAMA